MNNKNVTPQVHLFDKVSKLKDTQLIMIIFPDGSKWQISIKEFKEYTQKDVNKRLDRLEDKIKDIKITRESMINAFNKNKSISFGKPFNILADVGIEKIKTKGIMYSDGKRVRINLNGKWHTLKLE